ncbi:MAG: tetratricopeptide repeat protein [Bacteroidia bacterium]|nr:tetratricopeptide repeat protein [Bacteroidia bacterium]MDW8158186.1 tetratricopeptide repeat protein [Bacteroidia bacterium]
MKKKFLRKIGIIVGFSVATYTSSYAQNVNQLISRLATEKNDSVQVHLMLQIATLEVNAKNWEKARTYAENALELSTKITYGRGRGEALLQLGEIHKKTGKLNSAINYYLQALLTYEIIGDRNKLIFTYNELGSIYQQSFLYEKAVDYYTKALELERKQQNKGGQVIFLSRIAQCYLEAGKYNEAYNYFNQALALQKKEGSVAEQIAIYKNMAIAATLAQKYSDALEANLALLSLYESQKDIENQTYTLNNIGFVYQKMGNDARAVEYFNKAFALNKQLLTQNIGNRSNASALLINMGFISTYLKDYTKAIDYYREALAIEEKEKDSDGIARVSNYLAVTYFVGGLGINECIEYATNAAKIAESIGANDILLQSYKILSEAYNKNNDPQQAQKYFKLYSNLKQELDKRELAQRESLVQSQIEIEKRENELRLLIAEKEKQELALNKSILEAEKREKELALKQKELALLKQKQELQEQTLRNQQLEKERVEQALRLAKEQLITDRKNKEILELQKNQKIQELALKQQELEKNEKEKTIRLLQADQAIKEQRLQEEKRAKNYLIGIVSLVGLSFATFLYGYIQKQKAAKILARQKREIEEANQKLQQVNELIQEQNNLLIASEEELRSNQEELQAVNENLVNTQKELVAKNEFLEKALHELEESKKQIEAQQAQLVQSEKMAALGQLIAGIAHEVNTPLGAIQASVGTIERALNNTIHKLPKLLKQLTPAEEECFFDLLERALHSKPEISSREERKKKKALIEELETAQVPQASAIADSLCDMGIYENVAAYYPLFYHDNVLETLSVANYIASQKRNSQTIKIAVEKASRIVFALKNYARFDHSNEPVQASIIDTLETVLTLYHNQLKRGVEVIKNYQEIPPIECFPDELNQVWTNIIHNAAQAMDYNGKLEITVEATEEYALVHITDTGKGIAPEIQHRIFDAFFTTKAAGEGSGLGLSIVKKIIQKHQGDIWFESVPGKTTFTVKLPFVLRKQQEPEKQLS